MLSYEKMIPVSQPSIGREELNAVRDVFASHWLGMGAWVARFESELCSFLGAKHVVAVNTGTTGLHLALDSIGLKKGDEAIVPSLTFTASVQAVMYTGAKPVFCDIDSKTLNMDINDVIRRITKKTKVIIPVHYGGLPCDMKSIMDLASMRKIRVVEDAAHAFGSSYSGKKIGSFGDLTCFSFDPIKNITCGEGGAIATKDKDLAHLLCKKRILGIDKDTWSRYKHKRDWFYEVTELGYRYHMSNINAAIGLEQLKKFDRLNSIKKEIVKRYDDAFLGIEGLEMLSRDYVQTAPFNYIVKIKHSKREQLMKFLKSAHIDSGVHYIPNHLQPYFKRFKTKLPETEKVWKEILTLPLYADMRRGDVERIIEAVRRFLK